jgi:hypothetical protein
MGISGWDAIPGDVERGLIGEFARAIAWRLFRRDGPTVSDDGAAVEQYRRRDARRGFHSGPGRRARPAPEG